MIIKDDCVKIGFINKPHGVKGELTLTLFEGFYAEDIDVDFLLLEIDNGLVPFSVEAQREKGSKTLLVKFEDVESENKAHELSGTEVYVESSNLSMDEDSVSGALVGYLVVDKLKGNIGVITAINEIANNPLFEVDNNGIEILFPVNPDFILNIDDQQKILNVNLPEGLVDMYLNDEEDE